MNVSVITDDGITSHVNNVEKIEQDSFKNVVRLYILANPTPIKFEGATRLFVTQREFDLKKGDLGGECYRSVCRTNNARWLNSSTKKHYCQACMLKITRWPENTDLFVKI